MKRLPCDNLYDFIDNVRRHYPVDDISIFEEGERILLYNDEHEHEFIVARKHNVGYSVLTILGVRYYEALLVYSKRQSEDKCG